MTTATAHTSSQPFTWKTTLGLLGGGIVSLAGVASWSVALYLVYDLTAGALFAGPGFHDGGSNQLGPGLAIAFYAAYAFISSLISLLVAQVGSLYSHHPVVLRVLRFAIRANGSALVFIPLGVVIAALLGSV